MHLTCRAKAARADRVAVHDDKRRKMMQDLELKEQQAESRRSQEELARNRLKASFRAAQLGMKELLICVVVDSSHLLSLVLDCQQRRDYYFLVLYCTD